MHTEREQTEENGQKITFVPNHVYKRKNATYPKRKCALKAALNRNTAGFNVLNQPYPMPIQLIIIVTFSYRDIRIDI